MRSITIALFLIVISFPASATECTTMDAYAAESVIDYLDSWEKVYKAFKEFGHCDDAAIAEGFDDVISKLWAERWDTLSVMFKYIKKDPAFKNFVFKRIGAEDIPHDRWTVIVLKATKRCPAQAQAFCREIMEAGTE